MEVTSNRLARLAPLAPLAIATALGVVGLALLRAPAVAPHRAGLQAIYLAAGVVAALAVARFAPPRAILRAAYPAYGVALLLLLLAYERGRGYPIEARTLSLGLGVRVRVAEPMSLALALALARTSGARAPRWLSPLLVLAPLGLAIVARDFPSAATFLAVGVVALAFEGRGWLVLGGAGVALATAPLLWRFLHGYQRARVHAFLVPADPLGAGWMPAQVREMMRASGLLGAPSGHRPWPLGRALGDAELAFPLLGASWGFVGAFLALAALAALVVLALRVASRARAPEEAVAATALAAWLAWKSAVGVALALGLAPVAGISMPMLGYGGTSVVATLLAAGVLASIARVGRDASPPDPRLPALTRRADGLALGALIVAAVLAVRLFALQVL